MPRIRLKNAPRVTRRDVRCPGFVTGPLARPRLYQGAVLVFAAIPLGRIDPVREHVEEACTSSEGDRADRSREESALGHAVPSIINRLVRHQVAMQGGPVTTPVPRRLTKSPDGDLLKPHRGLRRT